MWPHIECVYESFILRKWRFIYEKRTVIITSLHSVKTAMDDGSLTSSRYTQIAGNKSVSTVRALIFLFFSLFYAHM